MMDNKSLRPQLNDFKQKANLTTDTDLYLDLLADKNKIKLNIDNVVNHNKILNLSISEDNDKKGNIFTYLFFTIELDNSII